MCFLDKSRKSFARAPSLRALKAIASTQENCSARSKYGVHSLVEHEPFHKTLLAVLGCYSSKQNACGARFNSVCLKFLKIISWYCLHYVGTKSLTARNDDARVHIIFRFCQGEYTGFGKVFPRTLFGAHHDLLQIEIGKIWWNLFKNYMVWRMKQTY